MRKIYFLLMVALAVVATSCEKQTDKSLNVGAISGSTIMFALIDSESNYILEKEPEAMEDIEIIYDGKSVVDYDVCYGTAQYIEIWTEPDCPSVFKLKGCAFGWGITTNFTVKFREHSWEITTTATTDYKNVSYSDWYKATIDGKPTEFIRVPVGLDASIGDVDPESDTKTYYTLAFPLYVE